MTVAVEKTEAAIARRVSLRGKALAIALTAAGVAAFLAANAHFLYVAVVSQPECVPHGKDLRSTIPGSHYKAANPAC